MGTKVDHLGIEAHITQESELVRNGKISEAERPDVRILPCYLWYYLIFLLCYIPATKVEVPPFAGQGQYPDIRLIYPTSRTITTYDSNLSRNPTVYQRTSIRRCTQPGPASPEIPHCLVIYGITLYFCFATSRLQKLKCHHSLGRARNRPMSVQKKMWNVVKGTPKYKYVSNPNRGGGLHNYGLPQQYPVLPFRLTYFSVSYQFTFLCDMGFYPQVVYLGSHRPNGGTSTFVAGM